LLDARGTDTPEHRSLLLNIVHAWRRLAEGAEFDPNGGRETPER